MFENQAAISNFVFNNPSNSFKFAVTELMEKLLFLIFMIIAMQKLGYRTGLVGTVETDNGKERVRSILTTPQGCRLQQLFAQMRENKVEFLSMEVSSHAISLGRVNGIKYDVTAFSNLSQDHLDFHNNMDEYFKVKEQLFTERYCEKGCYLYR